MNILQNPEISLILRKDIAHRDIILADGSHWVMFCGFSCRHIIILLYTCSISAIAIKIICRLIDIIVLWLGLLYIGLFVYRTKVYYIIMLVEHFSVSVMCGGTIDSVITYARRS